MASFRTLKRQYRELLLQRDWGQHLPEITARGIASVSPLMSLLPGEPLLMHRAAVALGQVLAQIAQTDPEKARTVIRRFMWHMSEESGNLGWGIPEAFGEALAASKSLAETYYKILGTYILDLGRDDNFCDNDILRRSCYWAIGRLAQVRPELAEYARQWLVQGLEDRDHICRGMAAWALGQLPPDLQKAPALRKLAKAGLNEECQIFDGDTVRNESVSDLAKAALESAR